jgi:sugar lactone lactonase YvrE
MNDGKVDSRGRFWAGTMAGDHTPAQGSLYRLQRSNGAYEVSPMVGGITIANGLDWSPDNRILYYVDSATQRIDRFDFDAESGTLSNRRPFVEIPAAEGLPDGMTVDAEGCIWLALFRSGSIRRYSTAGKVIMEVKVPVALVTSCAFGGSGLDELYITTARHRLSPAEALEQPTSGGLFMCRPGAVGRQPFLFG